MKSVTLLVSLLLVTICACKKDTMTGNEIASGSNVISYGSSGTGIVEGYAGYFSPERSPIGIPMPLPPGFVMSNYSWKSDSPECSYAMVYLKEKENQLETAWQAHPDAPLLVWARGNWREVIRSAGTTETRYLELSIDSLICYSN